MWSRLPEDLLDKVVQYLPIPALVRARAVCKRLRDFIFSQVSGSQLLRADLELSEHRDTISACVCHNRRSQNVQRLRFHRR